MASEPTIRDVMTRLDGIDQSVKILSLELRAAPGEPKLGLTEVRQTIHDLDHSVRDLWNEYFGRSRPDESDS